MLIKWRGDGSNYIGRVNAKERISTGFLPDLQRLASLSYTGLSFRGTTFSIVEDTQLLLSEKKEGVYAYVSQHLVFVIFMPLFWVEHKLAKKLAKKLSLKLSKKNCFAIV